MNNPLADATTIEELLMILAELGIVPDGYEISERGMPRRPDDSDEKTRHAAT